MSRTGFVMALGALCIIGASAGLRPAAEAPAIGVVDTSAVLARYEKWQDMQKLLLQRRDIRQKEVEKLTAEVETLGEELEKLTANSTDFLRKQGELIQKEALAKATTQQYEIELRHSEEAQYDGVIKEIGTVLKQLARELELTVVLQRRLEVPEGTWESVLYVAPEADMTERLIERLNAQYARQKK